MQDALVFQSQAQTFLKFHFYVLFIWKINLQAAQTLLNYVEF